MSSGKKLKTHVVFRMSSQCQWTLLAINFSFSSGTSLVKNPIILEASNF